MIHYFITNFICLLLPSFHPTAGAPLACWSRGWAPRSSASSPTWTEWSPAARASQTGPRPAVASSGTDWTPPWLTMGLMSKAHRSVVPTGFPQSIVRPTDVSNIFFGSPTGFFSVRLFLSLFVSLSVEICVSTTICVCVYLNDSLSLCVVFLVTIRLVNSSLSRHTVHLDRTFPFGLSF